MPYSIALCVIFHTLHLPEVGPELSFSFSYMLMCTPLLLLSSRTLPHLKSNSLNGSAEPFFSFDRPTERPTPSVNPPHLSEFGNWNPSSIHLMLGVGFPLAEHLSETSGPGCRVWSMKV